jgi:Lrp/AsnC family transcriptional regulator, leucine-responsive regulatory protein
VSKQNKRSERFQPPVADGLDLINRKILSALRDDGRLSMNDLAQKVGLSPSPCWTRVKRLEASGAIEGYVAVLNHKMIGAPNIVFVEITLDRHDENVLERFGSALARIPEVIEAYLVTGEYDYLVKVAVAGTEHYERFLRESLYRIEGIRHSRSTFALRAMKRAISVDPMLIR